MDHISVPYGSCITIMQLENVQSTVTVSAIKSGTGRGHDPMPVVTECTTARIWHFLIEYRGTSHS